MCALLTVERPAHEEALTGWRHKQPSGCSAVCSTQLDSTRLLLQLLLLRVLLENRPMSHVMDVQITWDDLKAAEHAVGEFGGDNRAGVQVSNVMAILCKSSTG